MKTKFKQLLASCLALLFIFTPIAFAAEAAPLSDLTSQMAHFVFQLSVIIFAAWFGGKIFSRIHLPSVLGEIIAGVIIGPYALGGITLPGFTDGLFPLKEGFPISPELYAIATIASIILLFLSGVETDIKTFLRFSVAGIAVGLAGVVVSFILGDIVGVIFSQKAFGASYGFGHPVPLFFGVIASATSVSITARILSEHRKMDSPAGTTILTAAVIDDVLGIIVLAIVLGVVKSGQLEVKQIYLLALKSLGMWLGFTILGLVFSKQLGKLFAKFKNKITIAIMSFAMALFLAGIFERSGLAMIIGAYIVGLSFSKTEISYVIRNNLESIRQFFVPIFFCTMGMLVNIKEIMVPNIIMLGIIYVIVSMLSKFIGCGIPAWFLNFNARGAAAIGVGMIPRAEVALIVAGIGLTSGLVTHDIFSIAVLMAFITTMLTPPLLQKLIITDTPMLRKKAKTAEEEHKEISYDMPNTETAELILGKTIMAFEKEGFYAYPIERRDMVIYEMRKADTFISVLYNKDKITFNCLKQDLSFVHTLFYEVIAEIGYGFKSLQESMDVGAIGKSILDKSNGYHAGKTEFSSIIHHLAVEHDLKSNTKTDIICELVDLLVRSGQLLSSNKESVIIELLNREASLSTGLQDAIAFPHCRTQVVKNLVSAIGVHKKGINFGSLDNKPSQIFVLTLIPEDSKESYLQYISEVSKFLTDEQNRISLISANSDDELYKLFIQETVKK